MGEHQTWFDYLQNWGAYRDFSESLSGPLSRGWKWTIFQESHFTLIHVLFAAVVVMFVMIGATRFHSSVKGYDTAALIPPKKWFSFRNIFEWLCAATFSTMVGVMGEKQAKKHFWFIASLAFFILFSNAMALIPGFGVPTATLKTNLGLAGAVFLYYNVCGIMTHTAWGWFKHFVGPVWYLYWLILPIEIISHAVRPFSLMLRLMGNMVGDHKVVFSFFAIIPLIIPVPFLLLGTLVVIIQAVVFCLLSTVYIGMAVAEDH